MVFPIILGSGTPKPTPTTNTHTCTTKKNTQKGPSPPSRFEGGSPPCGFFFCFGTVGAINPVTTSIQVSEFPFAVALSEFQPRRSAAVCPGFLSFRLSRLGNPQPTAERFRHSSGRGMRGDSTPDTGRSMAGSTEGGVKFFTESTAAKLKGSRICV